MDIWAQTYFGRATFLCISCDGPQLASAFAMRLQLSKCLLTYVDRANGPRWGQLGCNGFIVLDAQGKVACSATSAFLEMGERAFADTEAILDSLLSDASPQLMVTPGVDPAELEFDRITGGCSDPKADEAMPKRMKRALAAKAAPKPESDELASYTNKTPTTSVAPLAEIHSVHIPDLDEEHEECGAALAQMRDAPTKEAILRVIEAYTKHFAHEEALLDQHLYTKDAMEASSSGSFSAAASARRSHFADHQKMIGELRARAAQLPEGGPQTGPKAWIYADTEAPAAFVHRILRSFEHHANVYDANYSEPLAARLKEAEAVPVQ